MTPSPKGQALALLSSDRVRTKLAVGNRAVSMAWLRRTLSRNDSPLFRSAMSTVTSVLVMAVPSKLSDPSTLSVRPTTVSPPSPATCWPTRWPAKLEPPAASVQSPVRLSGPWAGEPPAASSDSTAPSRDTGAAASVSITKYHSASPPIRPRTARPSPPVSTLVFQFKTLETSDMD
jgi:hypothetical protein